MSTLEQVTADSIETAPIVPLRVADRHHVSGVTVLLVDAEPLLADSIRFTLERDGYRIVGPATHKAARELTAVEMPALVLMELGGMSSEALDLCRHLRASSRASIILMTPTVSDADRLEALQAGADDFLIKPFSLRELAHRVTNQLRRARSVVSGRDADGEILSVGPVEMDVANHEVRIRGKLTLFPPKEFGLLETLLRSRGRLQTRARLIAEIWGADYYGDGKTLDTHVKRLREKIELDPRRPMHLVVVRGLGYRFLDSER